MQFSAMIPAVESGAAFLGVFTGVVLVHEAGHYLAARRCGVQVSEFSLGFPGTPVILRLGRYRETSFTVRLLPCGGFVRFDADESAGHAGEDGADVFETLPSGKKAAILVAGSLVNVVAGFVLMVIAAMAVKSIGFIDSVAAVLGLMGMVISLSWSALCHIDLSAISGPVGVATVAQDVAAKGFWPFIGFAGLMSFSVGMMNLLPVPGFDGWHLVMTGIEALRGRSLSRRIQAVCGAVGLLFVTLLMVVISYHDVQKLMHSAG